MSTLGFKLETALNHLKDNDYFVWDDFLTPEEVALVVLDYRAHETCGDFKQAGVGKDPAIEKEIRSDQTYWLDPLLLSKSQGLFWDRLDALKSQLNERFHLGLWNFEGHYSSYPIDGFYRKHLDRFGSDDTRTISMVLYLNENWEEGDGGELKLHLGMSVPAVAPVEPIAGRLICFLSADVLHEVLLTHKHRMSFAGWWKRRV